MKRWFCLILVTLLIVPVLPIGAAAAEVYEFEYMEMPVALNVNFDFSEYDGALLYDGILPPGIYDGVLLEDEFVSHFGSPVVIPFDIYFPDGGAWGCEVAVNLVGQFNSSQVTMNCFILEDSTLIVINGSSNPGTVLTLTRIGDLPGSNDIGLTGFLDSVKTGFIEYSTANLGKVIIFGLVVACSLVMVWFAYRFIKRKVTKSVFKGRF